MHRSLGNQPAINSWKMVKRRWTELDCCTLIDNGLLFVANVENRDLASAPALSLVNIQCR